MSRSSMKRAANSRTGPAACSSSASPGRACCEESTATAQRFIETYWSRVPGMYTAGDAAQRDHRGYFWILGRIDDVINVCGHRLGTDEVESALVCARGGGRGRGRRHAARDQGHRHRRLRHARPGSRGERCAQGGASRACREGDRGDRQARPRSASRTPCPRPAAARSCDGCCGTSPPDARVAQDTTTLEDLSVLAKLRESDEA